MAIGVIMASAANNGILEAAPQWRLISLWQLQHHSCFFNSSSGGAAAWRLRIW